jgi:hypothetical protein
MTTNVATPAVPLAANRPRTPSLRVLGTIGVLGAPMMAIEGIYREVRHFGDMQDDWFVGAVSMIYVAGWVCSLVGARRLRATGTSRASAALFGLQLAGLLLAGAWAVWAALGVGPVPGTPLFTAGDTAWPVSHLLMLAMAAFVFRARVWRGWRRLPALVCGLALPAALAPAALGARWLGLIAFGALTTVGFASLGWAVRTSAGVVARD